MKNVFNVIDKKQRRVLGSLIVFLVLAIAGLVASNSSRLNSIFKKAEFLDLSSTVDRETYDKNVKRIMSAPSGEKFEIKIDLLRGQVNNIENSSKYGFYFLTAVYDENDVISVFPIKTFEDDREKLIYHVREIDAFLKTATENDTPKTITLKGVVNYIPFGVEDDLLEYVNGSASEEEMIELTKKQFNVNDYGGGDKNALLITIAGISVLCIFVIILIYRIAIKGRSRKQRKLLSNLGYDNEEKINLNYEEGTKLHGIIFGKDVLIYIGNTRNAILPYKNILNSYVYKSRTNGITTTKYLVVFDTTGQEYHIGDYMTDKSYEEVLHAMYDKNPEMIIGYDATLVRAIRKNVAKVIQEIKENTQVDNGYKDITEGE